MKQSLQLRLGQQLTMTPQLQQAIRLLQLSALDLQAEVQEVLENNPLLELAEGEEGAASEVELAAAGEIGDVGEIGGDQAVSESTGEDSMMSDSMTSDSMMSDSMTSDSLASREETAEHEASSTDEPLSDIPMDMPSDAEWDEIYDAPLLAGRTGENDSNAYENQLGSTADTLQDHLHWQMELTPFSEKDRAVAEAIIDAVSEEGYLTVSLESLWESVREQLDVDLDEVQVVLHRIQQFDPIGVGARDLKECLLLQLQHVAASSPLLLQRAKLLVVDYLELLGNRDFAQIMRRLQLTREELQEVVTLIQSLNPRPGSSVTTTRTEYVVPDVIVRKFKGQWKVELNFEAVPRLRINALYANLIKRADSSAQNVFLKNNLQEARWFIKSLQSRNETLLKVAQCIVERQQGFLEHGDEAMRALVLHDVAESVGMHESTISRVTSQKYMHTPRGIFELKYFFSSHVSTSDGDQCSATAIRAFIKKMVAEEAADKPLSDSKIASVLAKQGINVARRTVAKYREAMSIPPSNERKRLS